VNTAFARHRNRLELTFSGDWNWEQFYEAIQPVQSYHGSTEFDVIFDLREIAQLPMDAVLHLKPAVQLAERHGGKYIIIASGSAAQTLFLSFVSIYTSMAPRSFLVSDMEEANALLCNPADCASRTIHSA
jgi:hypothetical protein